MLLHFNDRDIAKLGIYDSIEYIDRAVEVKEKFEIMMIASGGTINPMDLEQYSKYFNEPETETDEAKIIEEDMKEFEKISKVLAGMNGR